MGSSVAITFVGSNMGATTDVVFPVHQGPFGGLTNLRSIAEAATSGADTLEPVNADFLHHE
jgi:hypothetical protein